MRLAVHNYDRAFGHLPSATRPPGQTTAPRVATLTYLLPFLDKMVLYNNYDQTHNWSDPVNQAVVQTVVSTFNCPSDPAGVSRTDADPQTETYKPVPVAVTDYSPMIGVDSALVTYGFVSTVGTGGILPQNSVRFRPGDGRAFRHGTVRGIGGKALPVPAGRATARL